MAAAPVAAAPMDAVAAALEAGAAMLQDRREFARGRSGVEEPAASLTAEAGMAVFRVAFERWVADPRERQLSELIRESLGALRTVAAA